MLRTYLPQRYQAASAHIVDSNGDFSHQIDVVVFDRQYSPFVFHFGGQIVVPAESVYAVFEAKQTINAENVQYAQRKVASVRKLHRTSLPVPYVEGIMKPKILQHIIGGLLTFQSDWNPPLSEPLIAALRVDSAGGLLDIGCIAAHGTFTFDSATGHSINPSSKAATSFLFELIARLQDSATVPMIDIRAYSNWLTKLE
jgi:hypothetical protein